MTTKEKPKKTENLYTEYKKAFPGRCKSESELLERLAFLLLMPEPRRTGFFTGITEEEVEHRHISYKDPNWRTDVLECVCGFKTKLSYEFYEHIDN